MNSRRVFRPGSARAARRGARLLSALLLALLVGSATSARASGFEAARFGGEHGHAAGATPFALYYNPGALSLTPKLHAALHLTLALHDASFKRKESDTGEEASPGANLGTAKLRDVLVSPALAVSYRVGDFTLGLGVFVPFAGQQNWDANGPSDPSHRGVRDGVARWQLVAGTMLTMYASVGAAYRYAPLRLSFGAAFNLNYNTLETTRALTLSSDDDLETEGRSYLDVHSVSTSLGFGTTWEALRDKVWLGLSYQTPPGFYAGTRMDGELHNAFATTSAPTSKVSVYQSLPGIMRFALRVRPRPSYELRLFGDYSRWSRFKNQCVTTRGAPCELNKDGSPDPSYEPPPLRNQVRNWHDTFGVHVGGSYYATETVEALIGLAYDGNPIPLGTLDPSIIEGHDISATLGARLRLGQRFGLYSAATAQTWLKRDNTGKSQLSSYQPPSRMPTAGGEYKQWALVLNTMVEFYFD
jgi:long-chain fatty acid transport protein